VLTVDGKPPPIPYGEFRALVTITPSPTHSLHHAFLFTNEVYTYDLVSPANKAAADGKLGTTESRERQSPNFNINSHNPPSLIHHHRGFFSISFPFIHNIE